MAYIPTFPSSVFAWKNGRGTATLSDLGSRYAGSFPQSFYVKSARTNESRLFLIDNTRMEDNDFYDGEAKAYFVPGGDVKVLLRY